MSADSEKLSRSMVQNTLTELLDRTIQRGFFGTVGVVADVKDGVVMQVREQFERSHNRPK